jgi:hypothetical protein
MPPLPDPHAAGSADWLLLSLVPTLLPANALPARRCQRRPVPTLAAPAFPPALLPFSLNRVRTSWRGALRRVRASWRDVLRHVRPSANVRRQSRPRRSVALHVGEGRCVCALEGRAPSRPHLLPDTTPQPRWNSYPTTPFPRAPALCRPCSPAPARWCPCTVTFGL